MHAIANLKENIDEVHLFITNLDSLQQIQIFDPQLEKEKQAKLEIWRKQCQNPMLDVHSNIGAVFWTQKKVF